VIEAPQNDGCGFNLKNLFNPFSAERGEKKRAWGCGEGMERPAQKLLKIVLIRSEKGCFWGLNLCLFEEKAIFCSVFLLGF
jgi:hypothetical protein